MVSGSWITFSVYYGLRYTKNKDFFFFNSKISLGTTAKNLSIYFAML